MKCMIEEFKWQSSEMLCDLGLIYIHASFSRKILGLKTWTVVQ